MAQLMRYTRSDLSVLRQYIAVADRKCRIRFRNIDINPQAANTRRRKVKDLAEYQAADARRVSDIYRNGGLRFLDATVSGAAITNAPLDLYRARIKF